MQACRLDVLVSRPLSVLADIVERLRRIANGGLLSLIISFKHLVSAHLLDVGRMRANKAPLPTGRLTLVLARVYLLFDSLVDNLRGTEHSLALELNLSDRDLRTTRLTLSQIARSFIRSWSLTRTSSTKADFF